MGSTKDGYETITGQFAIDTKLCAEPRVDPLLTVTYAYLEKGVVTQAISGPFDLGRPLGCKPDAFSGGTRLNPKPIAKPHKKSTKKHSSKKAQEGHDRQEVGDHKPAHRRRRRARTRSPSRRGDLGRRGAWHGGRRHGTGYSMLAVIRSTSAIEVSPSRTLCRPSSRRRRMPSSTATATMSSTEARSRISARIGSLTVITS